MPYHSTGLLLVALLAWAARSGAQVTFTAFPDDFQLVARVGDAPTATYHVRGTVTGAASGRRLSAKLSHRGVSVDSVAQTLSYVNGVATFDLAVTIPVARANHTLAVALDGVVQATAKDIVAGDVYVVNGQSNAEGLVVMREVDRDSFLRGPRYLGDGWALMQFTRVGLWMGRTANELSERRDVPVAAFNFAVGGQGIQFFRRGAEPRDGNFEASLDTLRKYGVAGGVKGLVWFQGETDAFSYSAERYRRELDELFDEYKASYGIERFYAFQTRALSCSSVEPGVMEGQRQLDAERADFDLMSTMNATQSADGCHYVPDGGYDVLGTRMAELILYREGGSRGSPRVLSPDVDSARITGPREISVWFETNGAGLAVTGNPYPEFRAEPSGARPTGGRVAADRLVLTFGEDISTATGITYLSHAGPAVDYLHSAAGPGVFTFGDVPFTPGDGAVGNYADARVAIASPQASVTTNGQFAATVTLHNEGLSTLRLAEVSIPTPPGFNFVGGVSSRPFTLDFDFSGATWRLPRLGPGDSATLQLTYFVREVAGPVTLWAELGGVQSRDEDSRAGNGTPGEVREDDEARIVIGDRARDCVLSARASAVACALGTRDSVLTFSLAAADAVPSSLTTGGDGIPALLWPAGTRREVVVRSYPRLLDERGRLPVRVTKVSDATCGTVVAVRLPDECRGVSSLGEVDAPDASLHIYPNPVRAGEVLRLTLPEAYGAADAEVVLWSATGRRLRPAEVRRDGAVLSVRFDAPAGVYVVAVGAARQLVTVLE